MSKRWTVVDVEKLWDPRTVVVHMVRGASEVSVWFGEDVEICGPAGEPLADGGRGLLGGQAGVDALLSQAARVALTNKVGG